MTSLAFPITYGQVFVNRGEDIISKTEHFHISIRIVAYFSAIDYQNDLFVMKEDGNLSEYRSKILNMFEPSNLPTKGLTRPMETSPYSKASIDNSFPLTRSSWKHPKQKHPRNSTHVMADTDKRPFV